MSKKKSQTPPKVFPPQDMGTIIRAFEGYALGDIEHNRSKPIAAFMLSICFLDQLSSFRYGLAVPNAERAQDLIDLYMPDYKGLKLYQYRNRLIHNYSAEGKFDINNQGNEGVPYTKRPNGIIGINTNEFIDRVKIAFAAIKKEWEDQTSDAYKHARETSMSHPVFTETPPW